MSRRRGLNASLRDVTASHDSTARTRTDHKIYLLYYKQTAQEMYCSRNTALITRARAVKIQYWCCDQWRHNSFSETSRGLQYLTFLKTFFRNINEHLCCFFLLVKQQQQKQNKNFQVIPMYKSVNKYISKQMNSYFYFALNNFCSSRTSRRVCFHPWGQNAGLSMWTAEGRLGFID